MTKRPHAVPETEIQKAGPLVMVVAWSAFTIIGLLFAGFVIGTGFKLALALWPN